MDSTTSPNSHPKKRWKSRLIVSLIMLALAFISIIVMQVRESAYWTFTCIMAGADALLSIGWIWYIKRINAAIFPGTLWHIILHWMGFVAALYLITLFIHHDIITHTQAGWIVLLLLSLTLYLAGVYTDHTFILIGITLALLVAGIVLIKPYLWLVAIPVLILVGIITIIMALRDRREID